MRHTGLALLLAGLLVRPLPALDEEDPPIPQDPQRSQQCWDESLAWHRRTLLGGYEQAGKKKPTWDEAAKAALEAAARHYARAIDPVTPLPEVSAATQKAVAAGCDDPLVLYFFARTTLKRNHPGPAEMVRRYVTAAEGIKRSAYAPVWRATVLAHAGNALVSLPKPSAEQRDEAKRWLTASLELLGESSRLDGRTPPVDGQWRDVLNVSAEAYGKLTGDRVKAFEEQDAVLARTPERRALRAYCRGNFFINHAWEARGKGMGYTVTEQGGRLFDERLHKARAALEEAWELEPGDARTATKMLIVLKGQGSERAEMEKWFERAMRADPNCYDACLQKMDWLDPKWHGSREEVLAFGRACRDTKNWRAGLTLLIGDSYLRVSDQLGEEERRKFMLREALFKNVQAVYEEYLRHFPDRHQARTVYAALCALCSFYEEADEQFKVLGDNLVPTGRFTNGWLKETRQLAADQAAILRRPPKGAQPPVIPAGRPPAKSGS